jgi:hypothetical protein
MNAETQTILDLEAITDDVLDGIAEAPDYVTPPAGEYALSVSDAVIDKYKDKEGTAKQRIKITYGINETLSLADDKEPPVPNNSIFTETFTATEQGVSFFKKRVKEITGADDLTGVGGIPGMLDAIKGASFNCRLTIKYSDKPGGGKYENVQLRIIRA